MKIGVTSSSAYESDGTIHKNVLPYVRAIERVGGEAVLLPNDAERASELLGTVRGIVAGGGVDVDVALYGGRAAHARSQAHRYRPDRDSFEIALLRLARERGLPTLCVCRGIQIANVAFGGTLVEDVPEELGARYTIEHRLTDDCGRERADYAPDHEVILEPDSALARLLGETQFVTNSMHHQAVRTVGEGLRVVGCTRDGVIEAVDATFAHPFFYAVQWHPEELVDRISARLFEGLLAAAEDSAPMVRR